MALVTVPAGSARAPVTTMDASAPETAARPSLIVVAASTQAASGGFDNQDDVARGASHCNHIGETHLASLIHEEPVERLDSIVTTDTRHLETLAERWGEAGERT